MSIMSRTLAQADPEVSEIINNDLEGKLRATASGPRAMRLPRLL
jgi:hypothetical protein